MASNAYEAAIDDRIHAAREDRTDSAILPGPPNRAYFLDSFFTQLRHLPFAMEITTPEPEFEEMIIGYEDGRPDPTDPAKKWRAFSLSLRMDLGGTQDATLLLRESPCESLTMASLVFAADTDESAAHAEPSAKRYLFREFLCTLINSYPVICGTIGLDIVAIEAGLPHDEFRLDNGRWLQQFIEKLRLSGREDDLFCVYINGSPWQFDRPFIYDNIEPHDSHLDTWAGRRFFDLHKIKEIRIHVEKGELAYARMYESGYPKDDRDDALMSLAKAISMANELGLEQEAARLKAQSEHINAVFNSQFRWR